MLTYAGQVVKRDRKACQQGGARSSKACQQGGAKHHSAFIDKEAAPIASVCDMPRYTLVSNGMPLFL
jgi:hypothetical protein